MGEINKGSYFVQIRKNNIKELIEILKKCKEKREITKSMSLFCLNKGLSWKTVREYYERIIDSGVLDIGSS